MFIQSFLIDWFTREKIMKLVFRVKSSKTTFMHENLIDRSSQPASIFSRTMQTFCRAVPFMRLPFQKHPPFFCGVFVL